MRAKSGTFTVPMLPLGFRPFTSFLVPADVFIIVSTLIQTILTASFAVIITQRIESSVKSEGCGRGTKVAVETRLEGTSIMNSNRRNV
jgi:hypothetical protein